MTLQETAYKRIDMLSDSDLKILLTIIDEMLGKKNMIEERAIEKRMNAVNDLLEIRKRNPIPANFDFDVALEEALKEKYAGFA